MEPVRVAFIGCVRFSFSALDYLLSQGNPCLKVVLVVTREKSDFNSDFVSLVPLAEKNNIPCLVVEANDQSGIMEGLKKFMPEVIFCFGWSYLLREPILKFPRFGVVGYHPAALPQNRGRHPVIWALALGLTETASTFFFMDEGADSGDILSQKVVPIDASDDASTLYKKLTETSLEQLAEFIPRLIAGNCNREAQDHTRANYWRKRDSSDGKIDWRMSAGCIHNLVRALTRPYVGAHFMHEGKEIKVWKTKLMPYTTRMYENMEPGRILDVDGTEFTVKCGEGLLKIVECDCSPCLNVGACL